MMYKVYICAPYSDFTIDNKHYSKEDNARRASKIAKEQSEKVPNCLPIAPQVYLDKVLCDKVANDYDACMEFCYGMLNQCVEILVCTFNGYVSPGMKKEIEFASQNDIPIKFLREEK